jgi:hypothetical protein
MTLPATLRTDDKQMDAVMERLEAERREAGSCQAGTSTYVE